MKTKKYYAVFITDNTGGTRFRPLKLSELSKLRGLIRRNKTIIIEQRECDKEKYKKLFETKLSLTF